MFCNQQNAREAKIHAIIASQGNSRFTKWFGSCEVWNDG